MNDMIMKQPSTSKKNTGFSLIELMIAMFIGIFVLGGVLTFFVSSQTANKVTERLANIQETGRFAVAIISRDLRRAGYFGGNANIDEISGTVGPSAFNTTCLTAGNTWGTMLAQNIYGLNDTNAGYNCISGSDYLRGDIVTVRFASPWLTTAYEANELYLLSSLFEGRVFLGSDVANANNTNITNNIQTAHQLIARSYYVGNSNESCQGSTVPALFWKSLELGVPTSEQLLVGVEHLQFEYGVDQTADSAPNQYVNAASVVNWNNVVSIRMSIIVRDDCPDKSFTDSNTYTLGDVIYKPADNFHRLVFRSTITLRNLLNNS
ncbi:PilW family protein [Colwellia piezophila]|uniref:PilW family protein n=1 Tax=Colwellia piezophila TaxID=211668 RepID=UPI00036EAA6C|nr:PilW family protein [Colwellia piezophila]